jgi:hypothetical protein
VPANPPQAPRCRREHRLSLKAQTPLNSDKFVLMKSRIQELRCYQGSCNQLVNTTSSSIHLVAPSVHRSRFPFPFVLPLFPKLVSLFTELKNNFLGDFWVRSPFLLVLPPVW